MSARGFSHRASHRPTTAGPTAPPPLFRPDHKPPPAIDNHPATLYIGGTNPYL
ncbi:MAG TPA: hypothetical protein VF914_17840 [Chloroflexia bacterium]